MTDVALIGFGEAAQAFVQRWRLEAVTYDRKIDAMATRGDKVAEADAAGVRVALSADAAAFDAPLILSLVTADQAVTAAGEVAAGMTLGSIFLDMNSVSPGMKRIAAAAIEGAAGRYIDVAVMSPVHPARRLVPLLVSGPHADAGAAALSSLGFSNVRTISGAVGDASAVKMIRSVMVKGIEALSAECALAADSAGVLDEVVASLDASWPGADWGRRLDYNLDRMIVHGMRRAAEMEEVVLTLDAGGTGSRLSRATVERQRAIGSLGLQPPGGLRSKLAAISSAKQHGTNHE